MGRLFLGACYCTCGYVADRVRREDKAGECPRCQRQMKSVTLDAIRFENEILESAMHCRRHSAQDIQEGWLNITLDAERASSLFDARNFCPVVWIGVKPDWRERVGKFGLHMLPRLRTGPAAWQEPVFVLDADEIWVCKGVNIVKAIWSTGGRTRHEGFIAWRGDYFRRGGVRVWAVSTTEDRAIKRLQKTETAVQAQSERDAADQAADMNVLADFT